MGPPNNVLRDLARQDAGGGAFSGFPPGQHAPSLYRPFRMGTLFQISLSQHPYWGHDRLSKLPDCEPYANSGTSLSDHGSVASVVVNNMFCFFSYGDARLITGLGLRKIAREPRVIELLKK